MTLLLHDTLGVNSVHHSNSYLFEAELMRTMMSGMPVFIDYLLQCNAEQAKAFRVCAFRVTYVCPHAHNDVRRAPKKPL